VPEARDKQPLVAVVTGVYNGQPYLPQTLACVQAQTYPNLVHVVLDNASTDATPDAIAGVAGGRVPILTRRNPSLLPQIPNWNAATAMVPAGARYVKLLPADDLMRADCIERMVAVAEANPDVNFVTAVDVFEDRVKAHGLDPARTVFDGREIARRLLLRDLHWIPFHHAFFRLTPDDRSRLFDPKVVPGCDRDLVVRLLLRGRMGFVNAPLFYTRYHASTVTAAFVADGALLCEPLNELQRYGRELMSAEELSRQLKTELHNILRHVPYRIAKGQSAMAVNIRQRLASLGVEPGVLDYIASVMTWPAYRARKKEREAADRAITPPTRLTEAEFLTWPVSSGPSRIETAIAAAAAQV
jgi:glycosyltransferase involved in cell wall biosynthesis